MLFVHWLYIYLTGSFVTLCLGFIRRGNEGQTIQDFQDLVEWAAISLFQIALWPFVMAYWLGLYIRNRRIETSRERRG